VEEVYASPYESTGVNSASGNIIAKEIIKLYAAQFDTKENYKGKISARLG